MNYYIKESKKVIKNAMNNNKLVIFVGAGVSMNSDYPSWENLVREFARGLGYSKDKLKKLTNDDYLKIPQQYYNLRGKKEYYSLINDFFNVKANPNVIHDLIFKFNPNYIITTNYDRLIEKSAEEKGMFYDVVSRDEDLSYTQNDKMIIKMHGDFTHNNIVLKEEDYLSYSSNFKLIENFIKSLFSSNVVLFIGYSLSDINVKMIFQWVRNILKEDFQPAYFIETDAEYNHLQFEYYKNRGINIINYDLVKNLIDREQPNPFSSKLGNRLYNVLTYLLEDEDIIDLDYYYKKLYKLNNLNNIRIKDIQKSLDILEVSNVERDNIKIYNNKKLNFLIKKLNDWKENNIKNKEEAIKLSTIDEVFNKANVNKIIYEDKNEDQLFYELDKEKNITEITDIVSSFNFTKVNKIADKYMELDEIEGNEFDFLGKAYLFYKLNDYFQAYKILKKVSKSAFKNKKYIIYFISEFNRKNLGKLYLFFKVSKETREKIKNEIDAIDLDDLFRKMPKDEVKYLKPIKEVMNFQFVYKNINEASRYSEKVEKEKNTLYFSDSNNSGQIHKFKNNVIKFWEFITENYLMVDKFREVKKYFYRFIESTLYSYSTVKEVIKNDPFFGIEGKTMKIKKIDYFTLFLMANYLKRKEIKYLFNKYEITQLKIFEKSLTKLFDALNNLVDSKSLNTINCNREISAIFNNMLYILSYINISDKKYNTIINHIIKLIEKKQINKEDYRNIVKFIDGQYSKFNNIELEKLDTFIKKLLYMEMNNKNNTNLYFNTDVFRVLTTVIYNNDNDFITENNQLVLLLLQKNKNSYKSKDNKNKIISRLNDIIITLYKICNKEVKKEIENYIVKILEENFRIYLYYNATINEIIKSTVEYEDFAVEEIDKLIRNREDGNTTSFPNPVKRNLINIGVLYLNDKLQNPEKFRKYSNKCKKFDFFINIDKGYNYDKFKVEWIDEFNELLHKEIIKDNKAKTKIKNKMKTKIIEETTSKEFKEIFFKYYD